MQAVLFGFNNMNEDLFNQLYMFENNKRCIIKNICQVRRHGKKRINKKYRKEYGVIVDYDVI